MYPLYIHCQVIHYPHFPSSSINKKTLAAFITLDKKKPILIEVFLFFSFHLASCESLRTWVYHIVQSIRALQNCAKEAYVHILFCQKNTEFEKLWHVLSLLYIILCGPTFCAPDSHFQRPLLESWTSHKDDTVSKLPAVATLSHWTCAPLSLTKPPVPVPSMSQARDVVMDSDSNVKLPEFVISKKKCPPHYQI